MTVTDEIPTTDAETLNDFPLDDVPPVPDDEPSEPVNELECEYCGRSDFKNPAGLKRHITRTHTGSSDSKPKATGGRSSNLEKELTEFFGFIAMLVSVANQYDGMVLMEGAPKLAAAWAHLARNNPTVNKVLKQLMTGSATGEVVLATMAVAIPIAANHNLLPSQAATFFTAVEPQPDSDNGDTPTGY